MTIADPEVRDGVVTFDDTRTSLDTPTRATGNAGYPSTLAGERK